MIEEPRTYPLICAPSLCPHSPAPAMFSDDKRERHRYAVDFCIVEHKCKAICNLHRPCMKGYKRQRLAELDKAKRRG